MNIVLDEAIEIITKPTQPQAGANKASEVQKRNLGTIVIRGQSVVLWENIDKVE